MVTDDGPVETQDILAQLKETVEGWREEAVELRAEAVELARPLLGEQAVNFVDVIIEAASREARVAVLEQLEGRIEQLVADVTTRQIYEASEIEAVVLAQLSRQRRKLEDEVAELEQQLRAGEEVREELDKKAERLRKVELRLERLR